MAKYTLPNVYTILTENKNIEGIKQILNTWFGGYNITVTDSVYNKQAEAGLRIEIIGQDEGAVSLACKEIKELNKQDQVWYEKRKNVEVIIV